MSDGARCDGLCCRAFVLGNHGPEYLQRCYDSEIRRATEGLWDWIPGRHVHPSRTVWEIETWWPWMIHLGKLDAHPVTGEANSQAKSGGLDYYACRQMDPDTGDCRAYESRPHFCRGYGQEYPCEHKGCKWQGAWNKHRPETGPWASASAGKEKKTDEVTRDEFCEGSRDSIEVCRTEK